jgi:uncharacterized protein (DUF58 family)
MPVAPPYSPGRFAAARRSDSLPVFERPVAAAPKQHDGPSGARRRRPWRHAARWLLFWLLAEAAAIYCAVVVNTRAIVLAVASAVVALMGFALPWISVWGVRGALEVVDRRGQVGRPSRLAARLRSLWPWPLVGLLIDVEEGDSHPATQCSAASLAVGLVLPWRWVDVQWTFLPQRRGLFPEGAVAVSCGFPFGFYSARRSVPVHGQMLVWPEVVTLPPMRRAIAAGRALEDSFDSRRTGTLGELTGARPHRPGESLRRIHWPQTARHNRLIVSERSAAGGRSVQLVVETDRQIHQQQGDDSTLEKALSVAASMTSALVSEGVDVMLQLERGCVVSGHQGIAAVLDGLARHEATAAASLSELLSAPLARHATYLSMTVVITTRQGIERYRGDLREKNVVLVELGNTESLHADPANLQARDAMTVPVDDPEHQALHRLWRKAAQSWIG